MCNLIFLILILLAVAAIPFVIAFVTVRLTDREKTSSISLWKILAVFFGAAVLIPVLLFICTISSTVISAHPSEIVDFHPSPFPAKADFGFFYSIADDLKYSTQIDPDAPTLLSGHIRDSLVSPDGKQIAVVANGRLQIVSGDKPAMHVVAPVNSIYRKPKPLGERFFRDEFFQWSSDSKSLYLIKDENYQSPGSQLHSIKGELWKYDIDTGRLQLILKPFPAHNYFFGKKSGIYFSVPDSVGNLHLKYFDGNHVHGIDSPGAKDISIDQLSDDNPKTLFFSFSIIDYESAVLPRKGVRLVAQNDRLELIIGTKAILAMTLGQGIKGPYYGEEMLRSVFLPGDRYFLFNTSCGNYRGQLLIDTTSGGYMTLPKDTRLYLALNTNTFQDYRITSSGIEPVPTRMNVAGRSQEVTIKK